MCFYAAHGIIIFLTMSDVYDTSIDQSIIKHTKSACLAIIESKSQSVLDHNRGYYKHSMMI